MSGLKNALRRLTKVRGVPQARHVAERAVAPYLRADVHSLHADHLGLAARLAALERVVQQLDDRVSGQIAGMANAIDQIEQHQPQVLNAIASVNGSTRLLRRELEAIAQLSGVAEQASVLVRGQQELRDATRDLAIDLEATRGDATSAREAIARLQTEITPHIETLAWLIGRVETVRAEVMNELRYGGGGTGSTPGDVGSIEPKIVNPAALEPADGRLRINIGCGHIPLDGFVNVDARELPGVDVVAAVDDLPFEPGSLTEIFSAHTLEHFPQEELRRKLLPYWVGLLAPGGTFRAVVPDMEAMAKAYAKGKMPFDQWRSVAYGGQEYAGDFHFTGFSPATLSALFEESGLVDATVVAKARVNGDCLECEVSATRPAE